MYLVFLCLSVILHFLSYDVFGGSSCTFIAINQAKACPFSYLRFIEPSSTTNHWMVSSWQWWRLNEKEWKRKPFVKSSIVKIITYARYIIIQFVSPLTKNDGIILGMTSLEEWSIFIVSIMNDHKEKTTKGLVISCLARFRTRVDSLSITFHVLILSCDFSGIFMSIF